VYPKLFSVAYVDELLDGVKGQFCSEYKDKLKSSPIDCDYSKFEKDFEELQDEVHFSYYYFYLHIILIVISSTGRKERQK